MKIIFRFITPIFLLFVVTLICGSSMVFEFLPEEVTQVVIEYKNNSSDDNNSLCDDISVLEDIIIHNELLDFRFSNSISEISYMSNNPFIFDIHIGLSSPPPEQA